MWLGIPKNSLRKTGESYDVKTSLVKYEPGDVWYLSEARKAKVCPKLQAKYKGPYIVTEK